MSNSNPQQELDKTAKTKKGRLRRISFWTAVFILVVLAGLAVTRFHIPYRSLPTAASWQWDTRQTIDGSIGRPVIIGHRGSSRPGSNGELIGNTASSIAHSIASQVDWIEIDIRMSQDGELVVFHDESVDLKTSGKGKVADLTIEQLHAIEVYADPPESILSLDEVFERFNSAGQNWIFDVKSREIRKGLAGWLTEKIRAEELTKDSIIIFGTYEIAKEYQDSGFEVVLMATWSDTGNPVRILLTPSRAIHRCKELGSKRLVIPVIFASPSFLRRARQANIEVWAYGSDAQADHAFLLNHGVRGLIVDATGEVVSRWKTSHTD
ncbi:MAG: glycerophosphodiester phosphodiesterase family protein, partial [Planctomycetota bacterium]